MSLISNFISFFGGCSSDPNEPTMGKQLKEDERRLLEVRKYIECVSKINIFREILHIEYPVMIGDEIICYIIGTTKSFNKIRIDLVNDVLHAQILCSDIIKSISFIKTPQISLKDNLYLFNNELNEIDIILSEDHIDDDNILFINKNKIDADKLYIGSTIMYFTPGLNKYENLSSINQSSVGIVQTLAKIEKITDIHAICKIIKQ